MQLIIGDAIAVTLIKMKGFKKNHFSNFHPGGSLGKDLVRLSEIMHTNNELPLAKPEEKMSEILIKISQKSFGCVGIVDKNFRLIGIITDGDLRRNMNINIINKKASDVMTKNPFTLDSSILVGEAINIMNLKKITSIFICLNKKPVGIIHIHDLLRLSS